VKIFFWRNRGTHYTFGICFEQKIPSFKPKLSKGVGRKISGGGEANGKKQDRKLAPLSLPLLYQYHV